MRGVVGKRFGREHRTRARRTFLVLMLMVATLVVASGVALAATKVGGPGNNRVLGTGGNDDLLGRSGNDRIVGFGGKDVMVGGRGNDRMVGGTGNDFLFGDFGSDRIVGGPGDDVIGDGERKDGASDLLIGGSGSDFMGDFNASAGSDLVLCGAGPDIAHGVDRADVVIGCERVLYRFPTVAEIQQALALRGLEGRLNF